MNKIRYYIEDNIDSPLGIIKLGLPLIIIIVLLLVWIVKPGDNDTEPGNDVINNQDSSSLLVEDEPVERTGGDGDLTLAYTDPVGRTSEGLYLQGVDLFSLDIDLLSDNNITPIVFPDEESRDTEINYLSSTAAVYSDGVNLYEFDFTTTEDLIDKVKQLRDDS